MKDDLILDELRKLRTRKQEIEDFYEKYYSVSKQNYYCDRYYSRSVNMFGLQNIITNTLELIKPEANLKFHPYIEMLHKITTKNNLSRVTINHLNETWLIEPFYIYSFYLHLDKILLVLLDYLSDDGIDIKQTKYLIHYFQTVLYDRYEGEHLVQQILPY